MGKRKKSRVSLERKSQEVEIEEEDHEQEQEDDDRNPPFSDEKSLYEVR